MKQLLLIPLLVFLNLNSEPLPEDKKEFEGVISYRVDIQLKNKRLNKTEIENYYGRNKDYFYKNGNYKYFCKYYLT